MRSIPESEWSKPATKGDLVRLESQLELQRQQRRLDRMFRRLDIATIVMWAIAVAAILVGIFAK